MKRYKKNVTITCVQCLKQVKAIRKNRMYCSANCQIKTWEKNNPRSSRYKPKTQEEKECRGCKNKFIPIYRTKEWCSKKCYYKY